MLKTNLSLCCGIGGEHIGVARAGFTSIGAIDKEPYLARLFDTNFGGVTVGDVAEIHPRVFKRDHQLDLLWASPNCQNFSLAKTNAREEASDIRLAKGIARYIEILHPKAVAIENVKGYVGSRSFNLILSTMIKNGYRTDFGIHESANFGVPQRRQRLILRGVLREVGSLRDIKTTHCELGAEKPKWLTWYEVTEHMLMFLEKSELREAGRSVVPVPVVGTRTNMPMVIERIGYRGEPRVCYFDQQMWTVKASITTDGKDPRPLAERLRQPDKSLIPMTQRGHSHNAYLDIWVPQMQQAFNVNTKFLAALQGLPANYIFTGKPNIDGRGIGNLVPPALAKAVAESFLLFS